MRRRAARHERRRTHARRRAGSILGVEPQVAVAQSTMLNRMSPSSSSAASLDGVSPSSCDLFVQLQHVVARGQAKPADSARRSVPARRTAPAGAPVLVRADASGARSFFLHLVPLATSSALRQVDLTEGWWCTSLSDSDLKTSVMAHSPAPSASWVLHEGSAQQVAELLGHALRASACLGRKPPAGASEAWVCSREIAKGSHRGALSLATMSRRRVYSAISVASGIRRPLGLFGQFIASRKGSLINQPGADSAGSL